MRVLNDRDLALRVQQHMPNLPLEDIQRAIQAIKRCWSDGLAQHKKCLIWPLGALVPRRRRARMFWSAFLKTFTKVPQHRAVIFRSNDRGKLILALLPGHDNPES